MSNYRYGKTIVRKPDIATFLAALRQENCRLAEERDYWKGKYFAAVRKAS